MNPLAKAVGTLLVLAAGTLGTSLDHGLLQDIPGLPMHRTSEGSGAGNATGNGTSDGNSTTGAGGSGNQTGNQTGGDGGSGGAAGNQTGNATGSGGDGGNATGNATGNQTKDVNETADPEEPQDATVCDFYVDEWGDDVAPRHHEWEWAVTRYVTSLSVDFEAYGGVPTGLDSHSEARLIDGGGRILARATGGEGGIHVALERGTDYLASGSWRLVSDSGDALVDYSATVHLGCAGE